MMHRALQSDAERRRKPLAGFTLTELLVVILIMGIMMAIALPSFPDMGKAGAIRSGVGQVRSTLTLARQYAITHRVVVLVVFAGPEKSYAEYPDEVTKCLVSYAVYDATNDKYIKAWETLPDGIIFWHDSSAKLFNYQGGSAGNLFAFNPRYNTLFPDGTAKPQDAVRRKCADFKFWPDGRASWTGSGQAGGSTDRGAIVLTQGSTFWPMDGVVNAGDEVQYKLEPKAVKRAIVVHNRSGRMQVTDL